MARLKAGEPPPPVTKLHQRSAGGRDEDQTLPVAEVLEMAKSPAAVELVQRVVPVGSPPGNANDFLIPEDEMALLTEFPAFAGKFASDNWGNLLLTFKVPAMAVHEAMRAVSPGWMLRVRVYHALDTEFDGDAA